MRDGYRIFDADRHVVEPLDLWREHLPPHLRAHAPRLEYLGDEPLPDRVATPPQPVVDGRPLYRGMSARAWRELATVGRQRPRSPALERPEAHLEDMDREGIDAALLHPTMGLLLLGLAPLDPDLAIAFAGTYNLWLRDFCDHDPRRLLGAGLISPHDPGRMVAELDQVSELGFRAIVLRPNPVEGRTLGHPAYERFWTECERRGIAVAVHEGAHAHLPAAGADRFHSRFALHACSHPMEQMMAFLALVEGGVLERHPDLRVAFLEAGCGFLPYWLWRLDEVEHRGLAGEVEENVRRRPSAYFHRQCFVAIEPGEPYLPALLPFLGEDELVFGTDFPHLDHDAGIVGQALALARRLPGEALRKILWDNPIRFLGPGP